MIVNGTKIRRYGDIAIGLALIAAGAYWHRYLVVSLGVLSVLAGGLDLHDRFMRLVRTRYVVRQSSRWPARSGKR